MFRSVQDLTAKNKLDEAKFFFEKMKEVSAGSIEWGYYLNAFSYSIKSVPDHLLRDYSKKYSLGFSIKDKNYVSHFERRAKALKNRDAFKFINCYKNESKKFVNNDIVKAFFESRDIDAHREIRPLESSADLSSSFTIGDWIKIELRDDQGKVIQVAPDNSKISPIKPDSSKVNISLPGLVGMDIHEACEKMLDLMRDFVDEAHRKFP